MIDTQKQWCIQIDVTNSCTRACSNCTRFIGHYAAPFFMSVDQFSQAVEALQDFPSGSPPTVQNVSNKVIGVIGGEPLLHPEFTILCEVFRRIVPEKKYRGLWTGLQWGSTVYADIIADTFGYINNNRHTSKVLHSPILTATEDLIANPEDRKQIIDLCWLQSTWSGTVTPKGFFFCEVAGAMDMLFDGPGGLPIGPGCWRRPLEDFQYQIDLWCPRCGIPLNLMGRRDSEEIDDITQSNLDRLAGSPRIVAGSYQLLDPSHSDTDPTPWKYLK